MQYLYNHFYFYFDNLLLIFKIFFKYFGPVFGTYCFSICKGT